MRQFLLLAISLLFFSVGSFGQSRLAVGQWQDHFAMSNVVAMADARDKVYLAFETGLVEYNLSDRSTRNIGRVEGLSDIGISTIAWDDVTKTLVVAYSNGNIDLLKDFSIRNVPDIINKGIIGSTAINEITLLGNGQAYFSTDFGIILLDIASGLSLDSYRFQDDDFSLAVNDVAVLADTIYAATNQGIWKAPFNSGVLLADFRNWQQDASVPSPVRGLEFNQIEVIGERIFTNYFSNEYPKDTAYVKNINGAWERLADLNFYQGIKFRDNQGELLIVRKFGIVNYNASLARNIDIGIDTDPYDGKVYSLNDAIVLSDGQIITGSDLFGGQLVDGSGNFSGLGYNAPYQNTVFSLATAPDDALFATAGGLDTRNSNVFRSGGIYRYHQGVWDNFHATLDTGIYSDTLFDFIEIAATSKDNFYLGSWGDGVLRFENSKLSQLYFSGNSPLTVREQFNSQVNSGYIKYDAAGNLWVANSYADDLFKVLRPNGDWVSVELGNSFGGVTQAIIKEFVITANNQIWISKAGQGQGASGLFAFQFGEDIANSNQWIGRNFTTSSGALPVDNVLCVTEDLDGDIWIGTTKGPAVFYNPDFAIEDLTQQAQQIFIEQDGNVQIVLETEQINAIEIDGGNRKWFATQSSGIFLFSEDVTELIAHYTYENSPLLSNEVQDLAILPKSGELFIATSSGIQSVKIDALPGLEEVSEVNIYPNPVRPDYQGPVTMDGFVRDTQLKITDTSGRLVNEIASLGGRATWNLDYFEGGQVGSGIYLILATDISGEETIVDRVLVVRN